MLSFIEDCQRETCPDPGQALTHYFETTVLWEHTSNLQLALHFILPEIIDGPAGVSAPVKRARLADIQSQHALVVLHQELGVFTDDHLVLHPNDLWLKNRVLEEEEANLAGCRRGEEEGAYKQSEACREGGRAEGGGRGEIRSTFRLDKSLPIRRDKKMCVQRSFCSTSCSSFRHKNTLLLQRHQNPL